VRLRHPLRRTSTCSKLEGGGDGGARVVKQRGPQRLRSVDLSPSWVWPSTPDGAMQQLIVRLARENPAGYQRIKGELLRLHVRVSASAIRETLRRHGLDPAPRRAIMTWRVDFPPEAGHLR
jgi:hypothetical protein